MVASNIGPAEVVIIAGARTPWAKFGGPLKSVAAADLAKRVFEETLYRGFPLPGRSVGRR